MLDMLPFSLLDKEGFHFLMSVVHVQPRIIFQLSWKSVDNDDDDPVPPV